MLFFYGEQLSASRPTTKLEDRPLSVVSGCVFNGDFPRWLGNIFSRIIRKNERKTRKCNKY
jgi:hypothetical protein